MIGTHVPLSPAVPVINVKQPLATILAAKNLIGLLVTGLCDDHFSRRP